MQLTEVRLGRGAGFGSAEQNAKVERAAVTYAKRLLKDRGFTLKSVEADRVGYDLVARRNKEELHVEVKGVAGDTPDFIVTRNEVKQARKDKDFQLVVVVRALTKERQAIEFSGREFLANYQLDAVAYRATSNKQG